MGEITGREGGYGLTDSDTLIHDFDDCFGCFADVGEVSDGNVSWKYWREFDSSYIRS